MFFDLNDNEMLEVLLSSEFSENLKDKEYIYLLNKFKFFYRNLYSVYSRLKNEIDLFNKNSDSNIENLKKQIENLQIENANLKNKINRMGNKKLSYKERITGKIIFKNEI